MNKKIMEQLGFGNEVKKVEAGVCPFCNLPVKVEDFQNDISRKEFRISGICQKCQDGFFV